MYVIFLTIDAGGRPLFLFPFTLPWRTVVIKSDSRATIPVAWWHNVGVAFSYFVSSMLNEKRLGDQLSFLSIKVKEESNLYPTLLKDVFRRSR